MPKVTEEYKEKKKIELLESALECFAEKGYQSSTMDDIVVYSNTSKGLLYNYYSSKEELYIALMEQIVLSPFQKLLKQFENLDTAKEKVIEFIKGYRRSVKNPKWKKLLKVNSDYYILAARQDNLRDILFQQYMANYHKLLVDILEEGIKKGEFKKDLDAAVLSNLFWSQIDGLCIHYLVIDEDDSFLNNLDIMETMFIHYIVNE